MSTTHGMSKTPEYRTWTSMVRRARNPNTRDYARYSQLEHDGILDSFEAFYAEVGDKPSPLHSIDRINNDIGYQFGNVRWATRVEQRRNTGEHKRVIVKGVEFQCAKDAAEHFNVTYATMRRWLYGYHYKKYNKKYRKRPWANLIPNQ